MSRSGMPWLFVVSLLAAGITFLVTGLRSDRASDFNINLLTAGVDFAVTSLVTAFVVERFRTLREARDQARLYDVVTHRLTSAAQQWVAALPGTGDRPTATTIAGAGADGPQLDLPPPPNRTHSWRASPPPPPRSRPMSWPGWSS